MVKLSYLIFFITLIIYGIIPISLISQEKNNPFFRLSGNVSLNHDMYSYSQENYDSFRPRFPDNLFRLNMQAQLEIGEYVTIPVSVSVTNRQTLYSLPTLPEESPLEYIQNPVNNVSINPKYKWAQAFLGTQTPMYSELTTGDIPIFGAGFEVNPGKFLLSASYGISQRPVEQDLALNIPGAFEQRFMAMRIGYGKIEGTKFTLNVVKIEDDVTSLSNMPTNVEPVEGITVSPLFEFNIIEKLKVRTETAGAINTSNVNSSTVLDNAFLNNISDFNTINGTTKSDFAHNTRLDWLGEKFQIGGEVKYVGSGFLPVGFRFVERDILDYKINTGIKFFNSKLSFNGSFGFRTNNLQDTKLSTTRRIIANGSIFAQITQNFNISANYSNFGVNNDANLLNQRIQLITNSFSLSPTYQFQTKSLNNQIGLNLSYSVFDQYDVATNDFLVNESQNIGINYAMLFKDFPLNLNFQTMYVSNIMPTLEFTMLNYGITAGYKLLDKKLKPSIALNFANIDRTGFTTDFRTNVRLRTQYKITKKLRFNLTYRFTGFVYGSSRPDAILNQNRLQLSLQQQF